ESGQIEPCAVREFSFDEGSGHGLFVSIDLRSPNDRFPRRLSQSIGKTPLGLVEIAVDLEINDARSSLSRHIALLRSNPLRIAYKTNPIWVAVTKSWLTKLGGRKRSNRFTSPACLSTITSDLNWSKSSTIPKNSHSRNRVKISALTRFGVTIACPG